MSDQFAPYLKLLELAQTHKTKAALREAITGAGIQILETEPLSGYYRCAAKKDGPLLPVAIWREGATLHVFRDGKPVKLERVWPYCSWNPIPYDWYEAATERGEPWPDAAAIPAKEEGAETDSRPTQAAETQQTSTSTVATPTAVSSSTVTTEENELAKLTKADEAAKLKREIEALIEAGEKAHADIKSEEEAGAAQSTRAKLNKFASDADKKRKALMEPWESKANAIHEVWQPIIKLAKGGADEIRDKPLKKWLNVTKPRLDQEAQQAAEQAMAANPPPAAPTVRDDGSKVPFTHNEPPANPPPAAPTATAIKGATGRAAKINTKKIAKVIDYDKLYQHAKAFPELKQVLERIAQRLVDAGQTNVPGVEVEEEKAAA